MAMKATLLVAAASAASALVSAPWSDSFGQFPLGFGTPSSSSAEYKCDLSTVLDPSKDGLPTSSEAFASKKAFLKQVERHQAIVRIPSICYDDLGDADKDPRWAPFWDLHDVLEETYPLVYVSSILVTHISGRQERRKLTARRHKHAKLEKINTLGLLYTLQGSDKSLKPVMLAAHQDVVPVADASTWTYPPFSAHFDGEWLWGRGSGDDKDSMTALMSALESLLASGWTPRRTVLLAFGFDEECSGYRGAATIGEHLTEVYGDNGIAIVLDEGGAGLLPVGDTLYALPAITEKGHVDIWFKLQVAGGHSSIPLSHTGIGIMSEIVTLLEAHPYEAKLEKSNPMYGYLKCMARYNPEANPDLTKLVDKDDLDGLTKVIGTEMGLIKFLIQTSQAVDWIGGGQKINALPEVTTLGVNYRVSQHNSIPEVQHNVIKYIDEVIQKYNLTVNAFEGDERFEDYLAEHDSERLLAIDPFAEDDYRGKLTLEASEASDPPPIAPITGDVWDIFSGSIQHTFATDGGKVVTTGMLMTGNTDTRHYLSKFSP